MPIAYVLIVKQAISHTAYSIEALARECHDFDDILIIRWLFDTIIDVI